MSVALGNRWCHNKNPLLHYWPPMATPYGHRLQVKPCAFLCLDNLFLQKTSLNSPLKSATFLTSLFISKSDHKDIGSNEKQTSLSAPEESHSSHTNWLIRNLSDSGHWRFLRFLQWKERWLKKGTQVTRLSHRPATTLGVFIPCFP